MQSFRPRSSPTVQEDVVIAVMGSTGSGKSSFVKLLTGDESIVIGHNIDSETIDVTSYTLYDENSRRTVVLVDTPGFDDSRSGVSDTDILKKIADFLVKEYDNDRKLNGLIYFHRISDPRFGGQSHRNLRMFKNLCGTDAYENVVIATTFWDKAENDGPVRERQLQSTVFKDIIDGHGTLVRHDRSLDSALRVIGRIFTFTPKTVRIVEEIREENKDLSETAAGSVRDEELDKAIAKHKAEMESIMSEMAMLKNGNEDLKQELKEARDDLRRELAKWDAEKADLAKGLKYAGMHWGPNVTNDWKQQKRQGPPARSQKTNYFRGGIKLGKEIPFVPNVISVPLMGAAGFTLDVAKGLRKKF